MKSKVAYIVLVGLLALVVIFTTTNANAQDNGPRKIEAQVIRYVDHEAGVVCWQFVQDGAITGASCLPLDATRLDPGQG